MRDGCVNRDDLERLHAGELDAGREAAVAAHLRGCAACAELDRAVRAEHEAFLGELREPPATAAPGDLAQLPTTLDGAKPVTPAAGRSPAPAPGASPGAPSPNPWPAIPGYEIVRELSRGGQGVVYQAIQTATKRKVAIKVLLEGAYAAPAARRRFEREIELVASLRHPNIVAVFDSGTTADGRLYCVMDYVRGVPLNQYVREKKLGLEQALSLFAQVCEAVQYAHQRGVIHRDLKPSNILVQEGTSGSSPGDPRVLDFGLAKQVGGPEHTLVSITGQVVGTLPYMSPEQARGNPDEIDTRTDVYALGVVLYELLTGEYPYPVDGPLLEVLRRIQETAPTPPSRVWTAALGVSLSPGQAKRAHGCPIDNDVETIVLRTLAKEPDRRYAAAADLARDLRHYLAGEAIEAKRDHRWYVTRKALRPYRTVIMLGALVLVALGLGYVFLELESRSRTWAVDSDNTRIISFNAGTLAAIQSGELSGLAPGLDARNPKSWRVLHGALLEKLSEAYPLVVTLDYFFPDEQPRYDAALIRGIKASHCPVIVGVNTFDVNGEPKLAASIREAVHGYGTLAGAKPDSHANEYEIPGAMQRGFETPIPGLAVAASAAARFPDCVAELKIEFPKLQLRYKKRNFESGTRRFREQIDEIPLHERRRTDSMLVNAEADDAPELTRDDVPYMIRVVAEPIDEWRDRIIPYHEVLTADEMQLRRWFNGKAIIVGLMIPPRDQWRTRSGDLVFGCQIHAQAIDQLLGEQFTSRYFWPELRWRTLLWAAAAGVAVTVRRPQHTPILRGLLLGCGLAIVTGLAGAVYVAMAMTQPWQVEIGIGICTFLAAFGVAYGLRHVLA